MMVSSAIWRPIASRFPSAKKVGRAKPIASDITTKNAKMPNSRARKIELSVDPSIRGQLAPAPGEYSAFVITERPGVVSTEFVRSPEGSRRDRIYPLRAGWTISSLSFETTRLLPSEDYSSGSARLQVFHPAASTLRTMSGACRFPRKVDYF